MITKVHDYVAYGEPSLSVLEKIISRRAEPLKGAATIDDAWISNNTEYDSLAHLTQALISEETTLRSQGLSPVLRLHPPRGGHRGIKHPTKEGGQLGKHTTEEIDQLLNSMRKLMTTIKKKKTKRLSNSRRRNSQKSPRCW